MTEAEKIEFNRKAVLANQWAREAESRRATVLRPKATAIASAPARAATAATTPAMTIVRRHHPAPLPVVVDVDAEADALAQRILASRFGVSADVVRSAADLAADAEAERILNSALGPREQMAHSDVVTGGERKTPPSPETAEDRGRAHVRALARSAHPDDRRAAEALRARFGD